MGWSSIEKTSSQAVKVNTSLSGGMSSSYTKATVELCVSTVPHMAILLSLVTNKS